MTVQKFDVMLWVIFIVLALLWLNSLGLFAGELPGASQWLKLIGVSASTAWSG